MSGNPNQLTTKRAHMHLSYSNFVKDLSVGSLVLIDDGEIEFKVIEKHDDFLLCIAEMKENWDQEKALTYRCPHQSSALTEKDRKTFLCYRAQYRFYRTLLCTQARRPRYTRDTRCA